MIFISYFQTILEILLNLGVMFVKNNMIGRPRLDKYIESSDSLIVAMNGPSLLSDVESLPTDKAHYLGANHFADLDFFLQSKPQFYIFSDPYFWHPEVSEDLKLKRETTYQKLLLNVDWQLTVFVPTKIGFEFISDILKTNKFIEVVRFNGSGYPTMNFNPITNYLWSKGLLSPFAQNVLIHAMYVSIMLQPQNVYIVGANFSFHESIEVDQQTNQFYKFRKHAYGSNREIAYSDYRKTHSAKLSNEFRALYISFRTLELLSKFAANKGVIIINYTKQSYLDMFQRPKS